MIEDSWFCLVVWIAFNMKLKDAGRSFHYKIYGRSLDWPATLKIGITNCNNSEFGRRRRNGCADTVHEMLDLAFV